MKGQELIDWIIENNLQNATVNVTALLQYDGDHDCPSTAIDCMEFYTML